MKYIFWGSPKFAEIVLKKLIDSDFPPIAIVCNPDKPVGRKKVITPPLTKILGKENQIEVFQPEKIDNVFFEKIKNINADFFIVAAYAKIIPQTIIDLPPMGVIGVHPSLLPQYRGASPIQSVLLNNEKESGVCLYKIDEKMDHGPILTYQKIEIRKEQNYIGLEEELAILAGNMLVEILPSFIKNKTNTTEQDHKNATFTKKFITEDGFVDLDKDNSNIIFRKIKALNPDPGVYTFINSKRVKLIEATDKENEVIINKIIPEGRKEQLANIILKKKRESIK